MDATLYTGNSTTNVITNSGSMQPDLVWIKSRSNSQGNNLFDSIRGAGYVLFSNATNAETNNTANFTSFNSNGFSLASNGGDTNFSGYTYVAWQWRASNAAGVSNTQGTITSTVSANPTAGFSIVTFTTVTSGTSSVGHGLGVTPSFVIFKTRSTTSNWICQHISTGTQYLLLNGTGAAVTDSAVWNSAPTSSVVNMGTGFAGYSGATAVMYCFAAVSGYSAFGSYTGNGSTDGPFIYTGFRPKYILIKRTDTTASWYVYDTVRQNYNAMGAQTDPLLPNSSSAEGGPDASWYIDALSNGFKIRNASNFDNNSSGTYIYACFAENPFKISRAR
jgi:hypothetical protein